jgi:hypothetical protein
MSHETEPAIYQEALSIKVGKFLIKKGLDISDSIGEICWLEERKCIGVLRKNPTNSPLKNLLGRLKLCSQHEFIGLILFKSSERCADEQNWFFEVYGRKHVEFLKQLADEMVSAFNVKIKLCLIRE